MEKIKIKQLICWHKWAHERTYFYGDIVVERQICKKCKKRRSVEVKND